MITPALTRLGLVVPDLRAASRGWSFPKGTVFTFYTTVRLWVSRSVSYSSTPPSLALCLCLCLYLCRFVFLLALLAGYMRQHLASYLRTWDCLPPFLISSTLYARRLRPSRNLQIHIALPVLVPVALTLSSLSCLAQCLSTTYLENGKLRLQNLYHSVLLHLLLHAKPSKYHLIGTCEIGRRGRLSDKPCMRSSVAHPTIK